MTARLLRIKDWESLAKKADFEPGKMAALCPISLRQLERYFTKEFHKTPGGWVKELKCRLAQEMIARGFTTKAVAVELKFANESHFCHEFKKVYGVAPQTFAPIYGLPHAPFNHASPATTGGCRTDRLPTTHDVAFKQ